MSGGVELTAYSALDIALKPSVLDSATVYVALPKDGGGGGDDAQDGATWASAKATLQAAHDALPRASDFVSYQGTIEVGYGTWNAASSMRIDTTSVASASNTTASSTVTQADVGSILISSTHYPGTRITAVVDGVQFTTSLPSLPSASNTPTAIQIHKPILAMSPGVVVRGRGRWNGQSSGLSTNFPTCIQDTGTGISIMGPSGTGVGSTTLNGLAQGCGLRDLTVLGNNTGAPGNVHGFYAANLTGIDFAGVTFQNHGHFGIYFDAGAGVGATLTDSYCYFNGSSTAAWLTGGIYVEATPAGTPASVVAIDSRFDQNFGFCVALAGGGVTFIGCEFSTAETSAWTGNDALGGTGISLISFATTPANGAITLVSSWTQNTKGTYGMQLGAAQLVLIGQEQQSQYVTPWSINVVSPLASIIMDGNSFLNAIEGAINLSVGCSSARIVWTCSNATYLPISGAPAGFINGFIYDASTGYSVPISAANAARGVKGAIQNYPPPNPPAVTLVSGTPWQNTTGSSVRIVVPITYPIGGQAIIAKGPLTPPTAFPAIVKGAAGSEAQEWYVPANWYFSVTLSGGATFNGQAIIQPV